MIVEIKVPSVGESVTEAILGQWFKKILQNLLKIKKSRAFLIFVMKAIGKECALSLN